MVGLISLFSSEEFLAGCIGLAPIAEEMSKHLIVDLQGISRISQISNSI